MTFVDSLLQVSGWQRAVVIVALAVGVNVVVRVLGRLAEAVANLGEARPGLSKVRTVAGLAISIIIFSTYFAAIGMALAEFGVSLTAYFASASVIGLAVAFGSQGLVQDVVTGVTVIFSDLFDVGDLVEISEKVGVVTEMGMRFTVLRTPMGSSVFIPNRTITSVINYPRGYVRCVVDVSLPADAEKASLVEATLETIARSAYEQFPGIHRRPPGLEGRLTAASGRTYLRYKFRIWPGRGGPIESTFKEELLAALRRIDSEYADWMVAISYEIEKGAPRRSDG